MKLHTLLLLFSAALPLSIYGSQHGDEQALLPAIHVEADEPQPGLELNAIAVAPAPAQNVQPQIDDAQERRNFRKEALNHLQSIDSSYRSRSNRDYNKFCCKLATAVCMCGLLYQSTEYQKSIDQTEFNTQTIIAALHDDSMSSMDLLHQDMKVLHQDLQTLIALERNRTANTMPFLAAPQPQEMADKKSNHLQKLKTLLIKKKIAHACIANKA